MHRSTKFRFASTVLGRVPDGLGQFRVANRLVGSAGGPSEVVEQQMHNGSRMSLDLADRTQAIAYLVRRFDPELAEHVVRRLPSGGTFFDIGANVGLVTFAVTARRPDAQVFAFEPNPPAAQAWARNKTLNRAAGAQLVEVAVGDSREPVALGLDGENDLGSGRIGANGSSVVPCTTLDDFCEERGIGSVDVVKIDVQGHEPQVLAGASRLLARKAIRCLIVEENSGGRLERVLHANGYRTEPIQAVGARRLRANPPMGDLAFVPAS